MPGTLSCLYGGRGISIAKGSGSRVYDTDGREYIDFFNGHGAALFGHANPVLMSALDEASRGIWSCGAGFESQVRDELAHELGSMIGDGRVFLTNSGTESVEAALKLAVSLSSGRKRILACRRSFHGRTCGALSLTFNPKYRAPFAALTAGTEHFAVEDIASRIDGDTAAVFIEPVQGEGGVHPVNIGTGRAITQACSKNGALLVADEVQTGLGRCGSMLASPTAGLSPDIVCVAKGLAGGLPSGAVIWKKELGDFPAHSHGSTYGGNELVSRVALAALKLTAVDNLAENAGRLGKFFRSALAGIKSQMIVDIRGIGLLNGAELTVPAQDVVKALQNNGLLALAAGPRVVRFLPSFAATEEDMTNAARIFAGTLEEFSR